MSGKRRAGTPSGRRAPERSPRAGRPRGRGRHPRLRRVFTWLTLLGLVGVLLLAGAAVVVYRTVDVPSANAEFQTETSFVYYDDGSEELGQFATQNRERVRLDQMSQDVKDAVVAIENPSFWSDSGIDPKGILRAAFNNAQGGDTQGGSTITQQYVKVLYLNQERSYTRKIKEAVLALKIQQQQSKEEILAGYLNTIYFGNSSYGVQAAAKTYFGVPAAQLDLAQSAALAAVLNNPSRFDPYEQESKKLLRQRYKVVLDKMVEHGDVTEAEIAPISRRLPKFTPLVANSAYGGQKGHMLEMVKTELRGLGYTDAEIEGGGLRVTTTFDQAAMANAAAAVAEVRPDLPDDELHVAVASVEPGTGAVKGFYGGQDYLESQLNWAVTGGAPGSTFKAFAVAAALRNGFSLRDTLDGNSPYYYNEDEEGDPDAARVRNEGQGSDGLGTDYGSSVSLLTATEESINTAFADLTMQMPDGPEEILKTSEDLGIPGWDKSDTGYDHLQTSPGLEPIAGIALGSATIAPINMANAYATIADGGRRAQVHVVESVTSPSGHDYDRSQTADAEPERVISADVAADTSYALQTVVESGTGANAQAVDRPAAGKTGTATNDQDQVSSSWFVGFTPQLATAVMYVRGDGNDQLDGWLPDYEGASGYFGSNYPTRTWAAVMEADLEGTEVEDLAEPVYLDGDADTDSGEDSDSGGTYVPPAQPTRQPSQEPTREPSDKPTKKPTTRPTQAPPTTPAAPPPPPTTPVETPTAPGPTPPPGCQVFDCSSPTPDPTPTQPTAPATPAASRRVAP